MCFPSPWVTDWIQFNVSCCQLISSHGFHGAVSSHRGHPPLPPPSCLLLFRSDDWIGFAWINPGALERISTAVVWAFLKGCASSCTAIPLAFQNTARVFSSSVFVEITHFRLSWLGFLLLNIFFIVIWLKSWQEYLNWNVPLLLLYILILIAEGLRISEGHLRLS